MTKLPVLPSSIPHCANSNPSPRQPWYGFSQMLQRLHAEGIYLHPEQLAEFLLAHGLPVDLDYVPAHLREKALLINTHYRGDMAALDEDSDEQPEDSYMGNFN
jgi:hypothetical protein